MAREDFVASHRLRVRWAEADMQGIVFNGHYLTYFDVAVTEYWRAIGLPYPETTADSGGEMYTVKSVVDYHSPARYDDERDVLMRCSRVGRSSLEFLIEIWRGADHLVSGRLVYVHADPAARKSAPLPARLIDAITRFERLPPQR
ncbi:MAG: acyl-CoA thioesterase [Betaproteobacteria bacterium]|nr:MAG: acyl-CoA thioesterase [Betaproteobacteria bacterium]